MNFFYYLKYILTLLLIVFLATDITAQSKTKSNIQSKKKSGQICITFDDLPVSISFNEFDRDSINKQILHVLKKYKVKAAGFVVGSRLKESYDIIGKWLNGGHRMGNQTFSNLDYNSHEINSFLEDVVQGSDILEPMLSGFGQKPRFFRFPYLHYGDNEEKKRRAAAFFKKYEIKVVPATVVVEDYLYNLQLEKTKGKLDSTKYNSLLNEYVNHVLDEIENSELLSYQVLGRNCRHILMLRANQLNAIFLDELLQAIKDSGYEFISLDKALRDKLYQEPEAYLGMRGVSYLEMIIESDPDLLPAK